MLTRSASRARLAMGCIALLVASAVPLSGCASTASQYRDQKVFSSPDAAAEDLAAAAKQGDSAEIEAIFGADAREILSTGDPVADRMNREVFALAMDQGWTLQRTSWNSRELIVGHEDWPFPIPLIKDQRGWWFDTAAGKEEVLARRIGRNELAAIGVLRAYVIAQREYASAGRDGRAAGVYAQKVRSDPGRHDGLYWPVNGPDEEPSPLGELAAQATAEGYAPSQGGGPRPYHGYYFRILTAQGPSAPGGTMSYITPAGMTAGFAMVACPAEYGNSGIMTFLVGPEGVIFDADLGEASAEVAGAISAYNPDAQWTPVD